MGNANIKVIHLDSEKTWGGGQQQAVYLFSDMVARQIPTLFVCQPRSQLHDYCLKENLPCRVLRMRGEFDLLAGYKIAGIARDNNFNIIHAHSAHALATALWVKLFYPYIKVIATRRVAFPLRKNFFSRMKYRTTKVDKIICTSRGIEKVMLQEKIDPDKLITIHSGIDIHKFDSIEPLADFRKRYGIAPHNLVVGTVAALERPKDYPTLLKAAKFVIQKYKDVTFVAVGSGKEEQNIRKLHRKLGLGNNFILVGFQRNIGSFLKNFDIFVLASQKEGIGGSLFEAQAVGLPVIGTSVGGIPEVISHGRNGLLVPPQNHGQLGEAILALINNKEMRCGLSRNAIEDFKQFDIRNTIKSYLELYERLTG